MNAFANHSQLDNRALLIILTLVLISCHKQPSLGAAADNLSSLAPPPMGAETYNDELKKELLTLEMLLDNKPTNMRITNSLYELMPELKQIKPTLSSTYKLWYKAQLYFLRRRFIESSLIMTDILKAEPNFHEARNWRARAIFFLGNPDLAIRELTQITNTAPAMSNNYLDALYLIGAVVHESNDQEPVRINTGIRAWTTYLTKASPDESLSQEINMGLSELKRRLSGEVEPAVIIDPFQPQDSYTNEKNAVMTSFSKNELLLALRLTEDQLKKTPNDQELLVIKARIYIKSGRNDEAVTLFKTITTSHPTYAPGFHYQGMAHMLKGQVKEALESWQKTFDLSPTYAQAHRLDQRMAVAQKMLTPTKVPSH